MDSKALAPARSQDTGQAPVSELETVLRRRAQRLGIPVEELRTHDRNALRASRADRIDCLDPYEVEQLWSGELAAERAEHIAQCAMCSSLVDVSQPSEKGFGRFVRSLAAEARFAVDDRPQKNLTQTLKELGLIEFGVALMLGVGFAALKYLGHDNITAMVLRENLPDFAQTILVMAIVAALLAVIWQLFGPNGSGGRGRAGRVVGGTFAVLVAGYLAFTAWTLSAAQSSLVATIADKAARGQVTANTIFTAYVPVISGLLVAEKTQDSFQLYWEDGDSRLSVGTAYFGRLARSANGLIKLRVADRDVDLKQTSLVRSADVGQQAVAVVPLNSTRPAATLGLADFVK
jgi:hypothetical protein